MNSLASFSHVVFSFAATYLLHSTVLLTTCWIVIKGSRVTSHFLVERMWKLAAVLGLVTAVLQISTGVIPDIELTRFVSADTSRERVLATFPEHASQASPVSITDVRRSTGLSGSRSDSMATVGEIDTARQIGQDKSESAARTLITSDSVAAPGEPNHAQQIGRLRGLRSHLEPVPVAGKFSQMLVVTPSVVQMVSIAVTIAIAVGSLLLIWKSLWLRRKCLGARVVGDGPARLTLDRFLKRNQIRRRVWLLASSRYAEPFTFGLFGWTIVLPDCTDKRLAPDELKALLAHEVAHLVRGDTYWLWIGQFLCTCLAFQPLNFLARRRWQQAAEYLCDDWAVERGIRSLSLAKCLTQIAEWRLGTQPCPVGLAAGGTKVTLVQRIERLIDERQQPNIWARPASRGVLNLAAVLVSATLVGIAPRVALSHSTESPIHGRSEFEHNSAAEPLPSPLPEQDWDALHQELLQLESDLERATHLLKFTAPYSGAEPLMGDIRHRSAVLRARCERISSSLGKESES